MIEIGIFRTYHIARAYSTLVALVLILSSWLRICHTLKLACYNVYWGASASYYYIYIIHIIMFTIQQSLYTDRLCTTLSFLGNFYKISTLRLPDITLLLLNKTRLAPTPLWEIILKQKSSKCVLKMPKNGQLINWQALDCKDLDWSLTKANLGYSWADVDRMDHNYFWTRFLLDLKYCVPIIQWAQKILP